MENARVQLKQTASDSPPDNGGANSRSHSPSASSPILDTVSCLALLYKFLKQISVLYMGPRATKTHYPEKENCMFD